MAHSPSPHRISTSHHHPPSSSPHHNEDEFDLESLLPLHPEPGLLSPLPGTAGAPRPLTLLTRLRSSNLVYSLFAYPPPNTLKLRSTSWLDGVRGVAAFSVFLFHTAGSWAQLVPAYLAHPTATSPLQFPFIRTFFVAGGPAVSVFFIVSGYVLTHRSLSNFRNGKTDLVAPNVFSSMFRRGFRLYLPPLALTFSEMIATRFGFPLPLNFKFVPEPTLFGQFLDWIIATNHFVNPWFIFNRAVHGFITHPRYDPVVWTIPLEYYGSFVCYFLLLAFIRVPAAGVRMAITGVFAAFCMWLGSWNMCCFAVGMVLADWNLGQEALEAAIAGGRAAEKRGTGSGNKIWFFVLAIAWYIAGFPTLIYPEAAVSPMPGFETLHDLIPMSLNMEDHARWWWTLSAIAIMISISQVRSLKAAFETRVCQWLGKISFSLYLVHLFSMVLFGLKMQGFYLALFGMGPDPEHGLAYWVACAIWYMTFSPLVFLVAAAVERWIDGPSVVFAKWWEEICLEAYRRWRR